jgi:phosphatidylglycerophosphatase A
MWWKEFLLTGFYSGYFPVAPGTAGSLLAVLIYILEYIILNNNCLISNVIIVLIFIYPSIKLGDESERLFNRKDPSMVVLDEMLGLWTSVSFIPFSLYTVMLAFIFFRIFDIFKPFPVRNAEKLNGGLGIMLDDIIAGVYTNISIRLIIYIAGLFNLKII